MFIVSVVDFCSLLLIILTAIIIGIAALFGVDLISAAAGKWTHFWHVTIGFSGVWQLFRQRWF